MQNPLDAELSAMRPSILPNLVAAAKRNHDRRQEQGGAVRARPALHRRPAGRAGGWRSPASATARPHRRTWAERDRPADALDAKADALAALAAAGVRPEQVQASPRAPRPGTTRAARGGSCRAQPRLAKFGELHPDVLAAYDVAVPAVAFELDLDALPRAQGEPDQGPPGARAAAIPPVDRDFAFLVDATVPAGDLLGACGRGQGADREVRAVRRLRGQGRAGGQEVAGRRGAAPGPARGR